MIETETDRGDNEIIIENKNEIKMNNSFNKLKTIQLLLKKESALKNLYSNTFKNIQNDINNLCREIYEQKLKVINVTQSGENPNIIFNHELVQNNKEYMKELYLYVPKLIYHLWENPSLMAKLLLNTTDVDIKQYLAPLVCDNFYENILSPNYIEDKLVLIIYILLEKEINDLKDINDSQKFLDNTACSMLLNELISKKDIKEFFRIILKDNIENFESSSGDTKLVLIPTVIEKMVIERQKILKKKLSSKKNDKLKEEIPEETKKQISEEEKKMNEIFFAKYSVDKLFKDLRKEKNENKDLKEKFIEQFIQMQSIEKNDEDNIYSNKEFFKLMNTNSDNAHDILKEYENNFLRFVNFLESIYQSFIENLDLLPFSIKCICKIISILLEKRFPNINEIVKFSFISKFIFNNLLIPVLINPTRGALINNYIISNNTMYNMSSAIEIIKRFTSFKLFDPKKETIFSPFNNFFIENLSKLIKINEFLIKTKIPLFIEKIIEGKINTNSKYDYFQEHTNEIIYNRSIFLSMNHVKIIMKGIIHLLHSEDNAFKKIVSKIIDNNENMQYLIELSDQNEKIIKKTVKNEKGRGKIQRNEQYIKYFLLNDTIYNEKYQNLLNNEDSNTYFKLQEKKIKDNNAQEIEENLIIKTKNLISSSLSNYRILEEINFGLENIGNTFDILKKLKHFMKSTNYVVDEGIPSEWYIGLLLENLKKLPEKYKENDYEKLYVELEQDIKKAIEFHDFELLSVIVAKMRFSKRRKDFYTHLTDVLIDINLNNNVNKIIENDEINVKFFFKLGNKGKFNIYKEDLSERQLDFLNSFVFQDDKDVKTCKTIKSFTNIFPDLNKYADNIIETRTVFELQKELNVPKEINVFFNIIKNHLINVKKIKDEKELNLIYNKVYDYVWSKIYNKLYPKQIDVMDTSLNHKFNIFSWIEPYHLIKDNCNYKFELILPKIVNYFDCINTEKSPRKKIMNVNFIFEAINNLLEFNQNNMTIGVDNQMPLLNYVFIKAKPKNIFTNCEFMALYIGDKAKKKEDNYLIQLKSIRDFTLNLSHHKLFNITNEEFDNNCKIALENKDK